MVTNRMISGLTKAESTAIRDYLAARTGLNLRGAKEAELAEVVHERVAGKFPSSSYMGYLSLLHTEGDGGSELEYLVSRLTVGETHFFRNKPQIDALRHTILPDLLRRGREKKRQVRIWSAGCSTGEEPFTIAMILDELLPDFGGGEVSILATDINRKALAVAREGLYRDWSFREVDEYYRRRYFVPEDNNWRIRRELTDMVTFRYLNLAEDVYPSGLTRTDSMDLVICRNVMIYFTVELCLEITKRFYRCLGEDGYFMVGHSEHSDMVYHTFQRKMLGSTITYRKGKSKAYWEKGLKLRFRGSGKLPADTLTHEPADSLKKKNVQRPESTEETVLFGEAIACYREMRMDDALTAFRKIMDINPENERALYMIALISANCGDLGEAEEKARKIIDLNPLHLMALYLLALISRVSGEDVQELAWLKKTIYVNRFFVLGHFQMGVYYLRQGKERLAGRSFLNVLDILSGEDESEKVDGVEALTVGELRQAVRAMYPGEVPAEFVDG